MKTLNTLVEDINETLSPLSRNAEINISDDDIEELGERIKNSIKQWARPAERNKTFSIRMSNLGRPARQLWFENKYGVNEESLDSSKFIKFLYGHIIEELLITLVKISGHKITDMQKEVNLDGVSGHIDCKIDDEVVDIKSASSFAFKKFKNESLTEDDPFGYITQLAAYEKHEGSKEGGFLVLNKESGELTLYQPEELDKPYIPDRIEYVKSSFKKNDPPPLCYEPVPEGVKGNKKLNKNCTYCQFKFKCFDSLRVFKYAKGPVFLSKVVVEPKVEEITNEFT